MRALIMSRSMKCVFLSFYFPAVLNSSIHTYFILHDICAGCMRCWVIKGLHISTHTREGRRVTCWWKFRGRIYHEPYFVLNIVGESVTAA